MIKFISPSRKLLSALLLATIILSGGLFTRLPRATAMPEMMSQPEKASDCLKICPNQSVPFVASSESRQIKVDKEPNNRAKPEEPYYSVVFTVPVYALFVTIVVYLAWYLRWRPPDLIKLYATYRI